MCTAEWPCSSSLGSHTSASRSFLTLCLPRARRGSPGESGNPVPLPRNGTAPKSAHLQDGCVKRLKYVDAKRKATGLTDGRPSALQQAGPDHGLRDFSADGNGAEAQGCANGFLEVQCRARREPDVSGTELAQRTRRSTKGEGTYEGTLGSRLAERVKMAGRARRLNFPQKHADFLVGEWALGDREQEASSDSKRGKSGIQKLGSRAKRQVSRRYTEDEEAKSRREQPVRGMRHQRSPHNQHVPAPKRPYLGRGRSGKLGPERVGEADDEEEKTITRRRRRGRGGSGTPGLSLMVVRSKRVAARNARALTAGEHEDEPAVALRPLVVPLTKAEIAEDWMAITHQRLTGRPKKSSLAAKGLALGVHLSTGKWFEY
eukprot:SM000314S12188  [mRNA]  locus=s314:9613:11440:- [translate_table: standard]